MTTKTGEKLRGRKRDPSVLEKAWATRRAKKAKAKRAETNKTIEALKAPGGPWGKPIGSKKPAVRSTPIRKAKKARTSRAPIGRRSNRAAIAAKNMNELLYGDNAQEMKAVTRDPNTYYAGDDQLIKEFIGRVDLADGDWCFANYVPRSQIEAVIRRLKSAF